MLPSLVFLASASASTPELTGHWVRDDDRGAEDWVRAGELLVGVGFMGKKRATTFFEVMTVEQADGVAVFTARPGGGDPVRFPATSADDLTVRFENPTHDFPTVITYTRDGDALSARIEGPDGKGTDFRFRAAPPASHELRAEDGRELVASGVAPAGDAGWTLTRADDGLRCTIWRRDDDGAWTSAWSGALP